MKVFPWTFRVPDVSFCFCKHLCTAFFSSSSLNTPGARVLDFVKEALKLDTLQNQTNLSLPSVWFLDSLRISTFWKFEFVWDFVWKGFVVGNCRRICLRLDVTEGDLQLNAWGHCVCHRNRKTGMYILPGCHQIRFSVTTSSLFGMQILTRQIGSPTDGLLRRLSREYLRGSEISFG